MTALSGGPTQIVPPCTKCYNKGYYLLIVTAPGTIAVPGQQPAEPQQQMMFCACPNGRDFRNLTIEFRLGDLEALADIILPALSRAQAKLINPTEAGKEIQGVIESLEAMVDRVRKAFGEAPNT